MVATEQHFAPRWTSDDLRAAVNWMIDDKKWSLNAVARELILPADQLEMWITSGETASQKIRLKIHRLIETFAIPHPRGDQDDQDGDESVEAEATPKPEFVEPTPFPVASGFVPVAPEPEPEPTIEALGPFPVGFATLWVLPAEFTLTDDALVLSDELIAELGMPSHILIGANQETGEIAIAPIDPGHGMAIEVPETGELGIRVVRSLKFPPGRYQTRQEGSCWIGAIAA